MQPPTPASPTARAGLPEPALEPPLVPDPPEPEPEFAQLEEAIFDLPLPPPPPGEEMAADEEMEVATLATSDSPTLAQPEVARLPTEELVAADSLAPFDPETDTHDLLGPRRPI